MPSIPSRGIIVPSTRKEARDERDHDLPRPGHDLRALQGGRHRGAPGGRRRRERRRRPRVEARRRSRRRPRRPAPCARRSRKRATSPSDGRRGRAARAHPPRDRGDDVRLVRGPDRAPTQQARRRPGDGELRHRGGGRLVRPGPRRASRISSRRSRLPATTPPCPRPSAAATTRRARSACALPPPSRSPRRSRRSRWRRPLQFSGWEWAGARALDPRRLLERPRLPPCRAAQPAPRHGHDGHARSRSGRSPRGCGRRSSCSRGLDAHSYFEVGATITTLILLGRYLEARAKRRSGAAIRALLELGAKEARILRDGVEVLVPVEELSVGRPVRRPARREGRDRRDRRSRASRRSISRC